VTDDNRQFDDFETTIEAGGRAVVVRITGSALHGIWGAGAGPQTAQAIFDENRPLFEEAMADKLLAGDVRDGVVVISDADLDM
jgi:hypothetical protein